MIREYFFGKVEEVADELKDKHIDLGMQATGDWLDSVEVVEEGNSVVIYANDYTEQLVFGRAPGNMPPVDPIEKWVNAKFGITGDEGRSMAFAVATKIRNEGTTWHQQGGSDLVDGVITDERMDRLMSEIGEYASVLLGEELKREFATI